jgi:hypothetical protein
LYTGQDLSLAVSAAEAASVAADTLFATMPAIPSITASQTINGNGGLNVIDISALNLANGQVLTLAGGANDVFILNISGAFQMGQNSEITGSGVDASRILINVLGTPGSLKGDVVGTILAVGKSITLQGDLDGTVIAGSVEIGNSDLGIESTVSGVSFIPEPATLALLGLGGLTLLRKRA